jgi:hypothetical protein
MAKRRKKQWTAIEKLRLILPIVGDALPIVTRMRRDRLTTAAHASAEADLTRVCTTAATGSDATHAEVREWVERYNDLGEPGLLAPVEVSVRQESENLTGTWDLISRYTDGRPTAARGHNYYDMDPAKGTGWHLITMWTEQNHFTDQGQGNATLSLVALIELSFKQKGAFMLEASTDGEILGNFGDYESGVKVKDTFNLARHHEGMFMVGIPSSYTQVGGRQSGGYTESKSFHHILIKAAGDSRTLTYGNSGMPATDDKGATQDVVDSYRKIDDRRPLIAGIWPIHEFYAMAKDPANRLTAIGGMGKSGATRHLFQDPPPKSVIRKYSP